MSRVWKFGDDVNTDEIIPARYNITVVPEELARRAFCEVRPQFAEEVQPGDILVAGSNFGCGSSREHAPIAIRASGVVCVVARSYARIFFRNAINIGLRVVECAQADELGDGHDARVDLASGRIMNRTTGKQFLADPMPDFMLKIVEAGGIVNFLKDHAIEELQ
jgi:3-isopropylmalate/(R)-2-methylmalate dehydratase small subunit